MGKPRQHIQTRHVYPEKSSFPLLSFNPVGIFWTPTNWMVFWGCFLMCFCCCTEKICVSNRCFLQVNEICKKRLVLISDRRPFNFFSSWDGHKFNVLVLIIRRVVHTNKVVLYMTRQLTSQENKMSEAQKMEGKKSWRENEVQKKIIEKVLKLEKKVGKI